MLICKEGASCCPLIHNITLHCTRKENSSHVRKPRTVLDSGFHNVDTGFRYLSVELGLWIPIVGGIPDSLSCIPDSKYQDFGSHKQNFPGFRNPEKTIFGMAMIEVRDEGFWWKRCGNAGSEPLSLPDPIYWLLARTRDLYIASSQLLSKYCEWTAQFSPREIQKTKISSWPAMSMKGKRSMCRLSHLFIVSNPTTITTYCG